MGEVSCGEFRIYQDIRQCASQNMLHHLVFKSCLKRCDRWDPDAISEDNVDKLIKNRPPFTTEYQGETYWCHGMFSVPMIVDGVKTQQRATVTYQDIPNQDFVVGRGFLESSGLRRAIDSYGRVVIDANASTTARLVMNGIEVKAKGLLDTGAGPNVMTEDLWRKLKSDHLLEAAPHLYSADRSTIKVHGKTPPISMYLGEGERCQSSSTS